MLALALALLACLATVFVWLLLAYRQLEGDLNASRERLPRTVASALTPAGGVLDRPQLTVVSPVGLGSASAAPLLLRTDPDRQIMAFLSLPVIRKASDASLIRRVSRAAHVPVNHSVLVSLPDLTSAVDELGGIKVRNPRPADYLLRAGRYWHFPAGMLGLDGQHAVGYMKATSETVASVRQQLVLEGVIHALLEPATISEFSRTARAVIASLATDLTSSDVLGLGWLRFHSRYLLQCEVTHAGDLGVRGSAAALDAFLGRTTVTLDRVPNGCGLTRLGSTSIPLPPVSVARAVAAAYPRLWQVGIGSFAAVALAAVALLVVRSRRGTGSIPHPSGVLFDRGHRPVATFRVSLRRWLAHHRGDLGLYTVSVVASVALSYLVLHSL